ncbi:arrestin domain-containing protein 17-like isoform X2 [Neocloeon triangulifer]|uniref:arrestin domain-containing protein 17-like isoform X2 n=1 Tax=Neocloeon triangulifer TaxID=2078957 RepID=UPI00286EC89F|nr:arrestin domain-containing protein 17-like isoform X2 [Neocloeon triangulifer]
MGLEKFQIFFDLEPPVFYSGRIVTGRIEIVNRTPKKIRGIKVEIRGRSHVRWTTRRNNKDGKSETVVHQAFEEYFNTKFHVLGSKNSSEELILEPGNYTYPFYCTLPANLPSSFEGDFGFIRYSLKAEVDRPWKFDYKAKALFTVTCPLDLNGSPELVAPVRKEKFKTFGCCCCVSGPLNIIFTIPTGGVVPGETLMPTLDVENNSGVDLNQVSVKLIKLVTFKAGGRTKDTKVSIVEQNLGRLNSGQSSTYERVALPVPSLPPSYLRNCNIIDLNYYVEASFSPSGCHRNFFIWMPLVIGTIPLQQNFAQFSQAPPQPPPQQNFTPSAPQMDEPPPPYPSLAPPTFEESMFGAKNVFDDDKDEHTFGNKNFAPLYPVYKLGHLF